MTLQSNLEANSSRKIFQLNNQRRLNRLFSLLLATMMELTYNILSRWVLVLCFLNDKKRKQILLAKGIPNSCAFAAFLPRCVIRYTMPGLEIGPARLARDSEAYVTFLLERSLNRTSVVVDAGADEGNHTRSASQIAATVIAVEPNPANFLTLSRNTHNLSNVTCLNVALLDWNGHTKLYLPFRGSSGYSSAAIERSAKWVAVPTVTLDSLLASLGVERVDLLKIDTEGAEVAVLKGAEDTLQRNANIRLVIEPHRANRVQLVTFLTEKGFTYSWLSPRHLYGYRIRN